ncbi:MAG: hypothetical protein ABH874_01080 [Methanobacteriota archaeon]
MDELKKEYGGKVIFLTADADKNRALLKKVNPKTPAAQKTFKVSLVKY